VDARAFQDALREAQPAFQGLLDVGLSDGEAIDLRAGFEIRNRSEPLRVAMPDPTLCALFEGYDVSGVEIGMARLHARPKPAAGGWAIGLVETDALVLLVASGEVVVTDLGDGRHVIWRCAKDGGAFLEALAEAARFLGSCMLAEPSSEERASAVDRCTERAGGDPYGMFYEMLMGGD
jgi:hypothetical protein